MLVGGSLRSKIFIANSGLCANDNRQLDYPDISSHEVIIVIYLSKNIFTICWIPMSFGTVLVPRV